jgi:hypothetical protein
VVVAKEHRAPRANLGFEGCDVLIVSTEQDLATHRPSLARRDDVSSWKLSGAAAMAAGSCVSIPAASILSSGASYGTG